MHLALHHFLTHAGPQQNIVAQASNEKKNIIGNECFSEYLKTLFEFNKPECIDTSKYIFNNLSLSKAKMYNYIFYVSLLLLQQNGVESGGGENGIFMVGMQQSIDVHYSLGKASSLSPTTLSNVNNSEECFSEDENDSNDTLPSLCAQPLLTLATESLPTINPPPVATIIADKAPSSISVNNASSVKRGFFTIYGSFYLMYTALIILSITIGETILLIPGVNNKNDNSKRRIGS